MITGDAEIRRRVSAQRHFGGISEMSNQFACVTVALRRILFLVVLAALLCLTLLAQVYSGSLTGVVKDPSGAAVPNSNAVLKDEDKGFTYSALSDSDARYVLRNLP